MGIIYAAHDTVLERSVALKVLTKSELGTEGKTRLLHEARAVASLNHPNIVTVFDAGEFDNLPFIVMELIEGNSLNNIHIESMDEILYITRQLCQALNHAHNKGIIHRDIKPENILITPQGVAKLTDFGLARSIASRLSREGLVGTVYYIAPEQAMGKEIDQRADLYSLGVLMYEMTTGKLPYKADDPIAVISQHLYAPLVPPKAHNPEIYPLLNALIVQLLHKQPESRPVSAQEVLTILERIKAERKGPFLETEPVLLDRIVRGRLVGRNFEIEEMRNLWKHTISGNGQLVLISGESGIGKTRLVKELVAQVEVSGGKALVGSAYSENNLPFAPFSQMIRKVPLNGKGKGLDLPQFVIADILTIAPDLRMDYPEINPNPPLDPQAEQHRLFENMLTLFKTLTQKTPLLMVLDDAHWADSASLAMLRHLARRTREERMMIIATYREHELSEGLPFHQLLLDLNRERLATRIKLTRLDQDGTGQLVTALFDEDLPLAVVKAIHQETEGNPFFIEEVCKALIENGKLVFEDQHWHQSELTDLEIPQSIRIAIQSRISKLPKNVQETLRLAAILGRVFSFETLAAASSFDENTLIDALEHATRTQLIEEIRDTGKDTFSFAHALIPATLREEMSGLRRRRLHRQAAAVIESLYPDDLEALAYQYSQAQISEKALKYLEQAGDRARKRNANEDAIQFYSEALELLPDNNRFRFDLLFKRNRLYRLIAQHDKQLEDLQSMKTLASTLNDNSRQCDVLLALTDYYLDTNYRLAVKPAEKALEIARSLKDFQREGQALQRLGYSAWHIKEFQASKEYLEKAVACFEIAGHPAEAAASLHILSLTLTALKQFDPALSAVKKSIALSQEAGNRHQEATGLRRLAIVYINQHQYNEAEPYARKALKMHQELGDKTEESHSLNVIGLLYLEQENIAKAEEVLRQGLELANDIGASLAIWNLISNMLVLFYFPTGAFEDALHFVETELIKAEHNNNLWLIAKLFRIKGEILFNFGQYEEALAIVDLIPTQGDDKEEKHLFDLEEKLILDLEIAYTQAIIGNSAEAWDKVEKMLGQLSEDEDNDYQRAFPLLMLARLALLSNDPEIFRKGIAYGDKARELLAKFDEPYLRENINTVMAELYLKTGNPGQALEFTTQAIELMEKLPKHKKIVEQNHYYSHYLVLKANQQFEKSTAYLEKAYTRVIEIAKKTKDSKLKQSWLENVSVNQKILAEWNRIQE